MRNTFCFADILTRSSGDRSAGNQSPVFKRLFLPNPTFLSLSWSTLPYDEHPSKLGTKQGVRNHTHRLSQHEVRLALHITFRLGLTFLCIFINLPFFPLFPFPTSTRPGSRNKRQLTLRLTRKAPKKWNQILQIGWCGWAGPALARESRSYVQLISRWNGRWKMSVLSDALMTLTDV